jgi:adenine deaminase
VNNPANVYQISKGRKNTEKINFTEKKMTEEISGMIVDVIAGRITGGTLSIDNGKISKVSFDNRNYPYYIMPGFVDAHIHIESSMLTPYEFARIALIHGTVATISDPHEIANVCGLEGVHYMIENARDAGLKFHFGAPSCVPATSFETAGAVLDPSAIDELLRRPDIFYLSEMMNYPGVLMGDETVMQKIQLAKKYGKPIDGHAPGLRGDQARRYAAAGITTDHECFTLEEALDKLKYGMKILIREGSAARNFDALIPLLKDHHDRCMFCCDDQHPDELFRGHINMHVKRAVAAGYDTMKAIQCATKNPVQHYSMNVGLLQEGNAADFIVVNNLKDFKVLKTVIDGKTLAENGNCFLSSKKHPVINNFNTSPKTPADFAIRAEGEKIKVIEIIEGQLITQTFVADTKTENGHAVADPDNDILKLVVVNRYSDEKPAIAFIKNTGLKSGAFASSVAHDSHNIIAAGTSDEGIATAVNLIIANKGGLSAVGGPNHECFVLPLPVAGLMSDLDAKTTGEAYSKADMMVKKMGSRLKAPYMSLSFMALLVIPQLKLSDKGLFNGETFAFADLFVS